MVIVRGLRAIVVVGMLVLLPVFGWACAEDPPAPGGDLPGDRGAGDEEEDPATPGDAGGDADAGEASRPDADGAATDSD